jgi:hypothetical protein
VSRNTVRAALAPDRAPKYERASRGSVADAYNRQIRALLSEWPWMPAPVMAERIGWPYSLSPLKKRLAVTPTQTCEAEDGSSSVIVRFRLIWCIFT